MFWQAFCAASHLRERQISQHHKNLFLKVLHRSHVNDKTLHTSMKNFCLDQRTNIVITRRIMLIITRDIVSFGKNVTVWWTNSDSFHSIASVYVCACVLYLLFLICFNRRLCLRFFALPHAYTVNVLLRSWSRRRKREKDSCEKA